MSELADEQPRAGTDISGRYRIVAPIGHGAQGDTQLAVDETTGESVAIKEVDLAKVGSWETVEIFERETAVLGGLHHPAIPKLIDAFQLDTEGATRSFLVQEFIEGDNLQTLLEKGHLFDEPTLQRYAANILDVLVYLHGNSPPVVHRDIKPSNLIRRDDGSLALVDFGAAQVGDQRGDVIGTNGYMPVEQAIGRAVPASDLYALGATLIQLATSRHPSDLQTDDQKLDWRRYAELSPEFSQWLDVMVAPMAEDRFGTAVLARVRLQELEARSTPAAETAHQDIVPARSSGQMTLVTERRPEGCEVVVRRGADRIDVELPVDLNDTGVTPMTAAGFVMIFVGLVAAFAKAGLVGTSLYEVAAVAALVIVGAFVALRFQRPIERVTGDSNGLVLHRNASAQRVMLDDIAGPEVAAGRSSTVVYLVRHSGSRSALAVFRRHEDADWLTHCLREFLVERRMATKT